jgi:quercetin dioxygenase-like cupin family protein
MLGKIRARETQRSEMMIDCFSLIAPDATAGSGGSLMVPRLFLSLLLLSNLIGVSVAQQPTWPANAPIKRIPLQKFDVPGTNHETVIGIAEIAPSVNIGRHTHPGPESGFMLEGEMVLIVEGLPDQPLKAGQSYQIPSGAVHDARSGSQGAKVIATYVVEKGKPLATPAP